jgi:hypothetical protein
MKRRQIQFESPRDMNNVISRAVRNAFFACLLIVGLMIGIGLALLYKLEIDGVFEWVW